MTVVPGVENNTVKLICDHCGGVTISADQRVRISEAVWRLTAEHGWTGSPFAAGPHRCPACAASRILHRPESADPALPPPGARGLRVEYEPAAAVVWFGGDIDLLGAEMLRQALMAAGAVRRAVVLDLSDVAMLDSAGLGGLVRAHRHIKRSGGVLYLAAPSRYIVTVLHTMRIDGLFPTFPDRRRALDHLAATPLQGRVGTALAAADRQRDRGRAGTASTATAPRRGRASGRPRTPRS
ncbi:STAS domain-containing protein [Plantactinospora sp. WMMC1484]|uniref:STAS domain-containing protein n=1 Tax=Plantactinospora sp. WMMC1484 TaxID=3404122 RepID=UPI003BF55D83